jgi:uncharacterized protein DUF6338
MGLEALIVLLFFLMPGLIADSIFRFALWRRDAGKDDRLIRGLYFSAAGLLLLLAGDLLPFITWDLPSYLFPAWWAVAGTADQSIVQTVLRSWGSHTLASIIVALGMIGVLSWNRTAALLRKFMKQSLYETAWQEFAERYFEKWVVVTTASGREFYGQLGTVSGRDDKDIVLLNPYPYEVLEAGEVISIGGTEAVFLPEDQIAQISVSYPGEEIETKRGLFGKYLLATSERYHDRRIKDTE